MPRVYPRRVLDAIGDELYAELEDMENIDEEVVLNTVEDAEQNRESQNSEREEIRFQKSLSVPSGITFDPSDVDNFPPLRNGSACIASCRNGLDNFPSIPPLFGGKRWPLL